MTESLMQFRARAEEIRKYAWVCSDSFAYLSDSGAVEQVANDVDALSAAAEAAVALLSDLDDAIAGADLDAWDAAYRIESSLFSASADRLRAALRPFLEDLSEL